MKTQLVFDSVVREEMVEVEEEEEDGDRTTGEGEKWRKLFISSDEEIQTLNVSDRTEEIIFDKDKTGLDVSK